jgi:hypothetical protein
MTGMQRGQSFLEFEMSAMQNGQNTRCLKFKVDGVLKVQDVKDQNAGCPRFKVTDYSNASNAKKLQELKFLECLESKIRK